jgi:hypothetical protein
MYCTYILVQGEENFRRKIQIKTLGLLYIAWLLSKSIMGGDYYWDPLSPWGVILLSANGYPERLVSGQ